MLTGCSVKYDISINEDLTIDETSIITETSEVYNVYYKTSKSNVLKMFLDEYVDALNTSNYKYELVKDSDPYVKLNKKYNNMEEYLHNSELFNNYFDDIKYSKNGNIIKVETVGFNRVEEDVPDRFYVNKAEIAIKSFYKVVNHNATKVDEKTNTYYYELDENTEDFKIMLEYDESKKFDPNIDLYIIIIVAVALMIASWIFVIIAKKKNR